jgi:hypothetical protein
LLLLLLLLLLICGLSRSMGDPPVSSPPLFFSCFVYEPLEAGRVEALVILRKYM